MLACDHGQGWGRGPPLRLRDTQHVSLNLGHGQRTFNKALIPQIYLLAQPQPYTLDLATDAGFHEFPVPPTGI